MKLSLAVLFASALAVSAPAHAQPVDAGSTILVDDAALAPADVGSAAGSGSAVVVDVDPQTGSATSTDGQVDTLPELKTAYEELREKYKAAKDAKPEERVFLIAVLLSAVLKLMLDGVNFAAKYRWKKALGWIALALAVPIALLSHYVVSLSWWDAIVMAGAGPGAIVVHELLKKLREKKPAAPAAT